MTEDMFQNIIENICVHIPTVVGIYFQSMDYTGIFDFISDYNDISEFINTFALHIRCEKV